MDLRTYLSSTRQTEFAEALGVSQALVSLWLTGKRRIPAERLAEIERVTGGQVTRHELRPDLFPTPPAAAAA